MAGHRRRPNRCRIKAAQLRVQCSKLYPDRESIHKACMDHIKIFEKQRVPKFHPDYGAEKEILHLNTICRQYEKMLKPGRYDYILRTAGHTISVLCYLWQVKNGKVVAQGLQYLYGYMHYYSFYRFLFSEALHHPLETSLTTPRYPMAKVEGFPPINYLLYHAAKAKATVNGIPFADIRIKHYRGFNPSLLYYAAFNRKPLAIKALLRYGATITPPPGKPQWVASLVLKLIGKAVKLGVLEDADGERQEERGWKELECANALLQAMPPMSLRHIRFRANDHWKSHFIDSEDFVTTMSDRGFVPRLKYCFLLEPVSLKHMCRVVVRERLQKNRELPFGIGKLEVPRELKVYLNLEGEE